MGILTLEVLRNAWVRAIHGVAPDEPHVCQYGDTPGALSNCTRVVPPNEGYRKNRMVFCSDEHAALDQEEQAF